MEHPMTIQLPPRAQIASFDVDSQKAFTPLCPDELPVPDGDQIADELNRQARFATYRIGSKDAHSPKAIWVADDAHPQFSPVDGDNVDIHWVEHAVPGSAGFELIDGLPKICDYDFFVWKGIELDMHPYGNCYHDFAEKLSTGVIEFLQARQVTTVLIGGLTTDYCVKNTALQLAKAGFDVILNLAACRGIAEDTIEAALTEMRDNGVRIIDNSDKLINAEN
jgi:nicotinamidase/pyrazinamidase